MCVQLMDTVLDNIILQPVLQWGQKFWANRDQRLDEWPLMSSSLPTIFFIVIYNIIAVKVGPVFMKNRESFDLRKILIIYNVCMVIVNGYLVYQIWILAWGNDYNWICEPLDTSLNPRSLKIAKCAWLYFMCKYLDWLDTFFFILKKKFNHLSPLHIYHHTIMPCLAWMGTRVMPGGQPTMIILLNGSIHVIMHSYYCIAAFGPKYQKYLWWKKYLTILQMVQFAILFVHGLQVFWHNCDLGVPKELSIPFFAIPVSFFYLFAQFYEQSYSQSQKKIQ